jgi:hypothetical protein
MAVPVLRPRSRTTAARKVAHGFTVDPETRDNPQCT